MENEGGGSKAVWNFWEINPFWERHPSLKVKFGTSEQNWDFFRSLVPIGTKSQIWDLVGNTGITVFSILHRVNRRLARYSLRATTTNQPTNRAPNKPARSICAQKSSGTHISENH